MYIARCLLQTHVYTLYIVHCTVLITDTYTCTCTYGVEPHPRQLINFFFGRVTDCLGCVVLLCLVVCLTLLASFFLPSSPSSLSQYLYITKFYTHITLCLIVQTHLHTCICMYIITLTNMYIVNYRLVSPVMRLREDAVCIIALCIYRASDPVRYVVQYVVYSITH